MTLKERRVLWEKDAEEVSHIGDSMTVLVVLKRDDAYFCHRYVNLGRFQADDSPRKAVLYTSDRDRWDCSVDLRDVTADECIQWLVGTLTSGLVSAWRP